MNIVLAYLFRVLFKIHLIDNLMNTKTSQIFSKKQNLHDYSLKIKQINKGKVIISINQLQSIIDASVKMHQELQQERSEKQELKVELLKMQQDLQREKKEKEAIETINWQLQEFKQLYMQTQNSQQDILTNQITSLQQNLLAKIQYFAQINQLNHNNSAQKGKKSQNVRKKSQLNEIKAKQYTSIGVNKQISQYENEIQRLAEEREEQMQAIRELQLTISSLSKDFQKKSQNQYILLKEINENKAKIQEKDQEISSLKQKTALLLIQKPQLQLSPLQNSSKINLDSRNDSV